MTATLRLTGLLHDRLVAMARGSVETGAVLLAHQITIDDQVVLLGDDLIAVPEDAYEIRTDQALQITSDGYVHALKIARERGMIAIWVHSHPGDHAVPRPSRHDRAVNEQLRPLFGDRTETGLYGYLVVSHDSGTLSFTGGLSGRITTPITCVSATGDRWTFRPAHDIDPANVKFRDTFGVPSPSSSATR